MMKRVSKPHFSKPVWVIIISGLVILVLGGVFWWLQTDWSQHLNRQDEATRDSQQAARLVLSGEELSAETLDSTAASLQAVSNTPCELEWWQAWRRNLSDEATQTETACSQLQQDSLAAAKAIESLTDRIGHEQQLAQIISDNLKTVAKLEPDQYDAAAAAWNDTAGKLADLAVDDSLQQSTEQLVKQAKVIAKAYDGLKAANSSQKRPGYDDATVDLQRAHQTFSSLHSQLADSYRALATEVIAALQKLQ